MKIIIKGSPKYITSKEIRHAIQWFGERLLGKRLCRHVNIKIVNENIKGFRAQVICLDPSLPARNFLITIRTRLTKPVYIKCLAHEMVHVKQFARKQLNINEE